MDPQAREGLLKSLEDSIEFYSRVGDRVKLRELHKALQCLSLIDSVRKRRKAALTPPPKEERVEV